MKAKLAATWLASLAVTCPFAVFAADLDREHSEPKHKYAQHENRASHADYAAITSTSVPEPTSIALLAAGLVGIYVARRSKK